MGIKITYGPSAESVGNVGYASGLGNWQREQQKLALAYDQELFASQRQQQAQQFAALQNALGMQNQRQARREELGTRLAMDEIGRRRELEDEGRRREWEVADRDAGFAAISERMAADDARTAEMRRRETVDTGLADGSWIVDPSVQKRIDQLNSDIGTWSNRDDVDEDVWQGKVQELNKRRDDLIYGSARQARPEERPKPTPQQFAEESVPLDMPDGSKIFVGRDRSGAWREITKWEPNQTESPEAKQAREDATAQAKIAADAEKTLLARKKQIEDAERKWVEDAYKRFDDTIVDPKADSTPPKDLAKKARQQFYDARPEDSMFMARFRAREVFDAAQVTLPPRPSDLMTPPSPVVQEQPAAPVAPQQAPPPVAQEQVQQAPPTELSMLATLPDDRLAAIAKQHAVPEVRQAAQNQLDKNLRQYYEQFGMENPDRQAQAATSTAELPPQGFAFPNNDPSKLPVPKGRTIADLDKAGVKVGDLFYDENDGRTKRRVR